MVAYQILFKNEYNPRLGILWHAFTGFQTFELCLMNHHSVFPQIFKLNLGIEKDKYGDLTVNGIWVDGKIREKTANAINMI